MVWLARASQFFVGSHDVFKCWYRPQICCWLRLYSRRRRADKRHAFRHFEVADNERSHKVVDDLQCAVNAVSEQARTARGYIIARDERLPPIYDAAVKDFATNIAQLRGDITGRPELLSLIDKVEIAGANWRNEVGEPMIRLTRDNSTSEKAAEVSKSARSTELFTAVKNQVQEALTQADTWSAAAQRDQDRLMNEAHLALIVGGLTSLLLAILVGWWLTRGIAQPVTEMTDVMKKLADGDITIAVSGITRKDELGRMAEAVQVFKDQAIKKLKKKAEEERRARSVRSLASSMRSRSKPIFLP
jgi:methyl-accepting chemotaxis protein